MDGRRWWHMNIFTRVKEFFMNLFKTSAEKEFGVDIISSDFMEIAQTEWQNIIKGRPYWTNDDVRTINFAKFLCYYTSKKTCLDLNVTISGSDRADYINQCISAMIKNLSGIKWRMPAARVVLFLNQAVHITRRERLIM